MPGILFPREPLALQTRQKSNVANEINEIQPTAGMRQQADDYKRKYRREFHRNTDPTSTYNCHGLTFAARRTQIFDPAEILKILAEDGYNLISRSALEPGDIAIYRNPTNGDIEHSGIVVERTDYGARILSKWGSCHEVVHSVAESPYDASAVEYYRLKQ